MERAESVIVQVAPTFEQAKIQEMETFGWVLQSRQEIHEEGDTLGQPSILQPDTYIIKTKIHHYVKLHFIRSFNLPNYQEFKRIEDECRKQPFPRLPSLKSYFWVLIFPGPITLLALCLLPFLSDSRDAQQGRQGGLMFAGIAFLWLVLKLWIRSRNVKIRNASAQRCQELIAQLPPISQAESSPEAGQGDTKACPLCGENIKASAVICRFCNNKLPVAS